MEYIDTEMARCITFPHPFSSERKISDVPRGTLVEDAIISQEIEKKYAPNIVVHIWKGDDGETFNTFPREKWSTHRLEDDETLVISTQPKGKISSGITKFSTWFEGLDPLTKFGLQIAGTLGLNSLLGGKQNKFTSSQKGSYSNTYNLTGPANERRIYQPIERVYGTHRVYPSLAAGSFSTCTGSSQSIDALFCFGYGPLSITDIKIGETAITSISDATYELRYGYDDDEPIERFPSGIKADGHSIDMSDRTYYVRTTSVECIKADIEILYPDGLFRYGTTKSVRAVEHRLFIEYKLTTEDDSAYVTAYSTPATGEYKRKKKERFSETRRVDFPSKAKYDVRVHIERATAHLTNGPSTSIWTQTKCITGEEGGDLVSISGVALMSLAMANAQSINGQIENLSAVCSSIINVWDFDAEEWVEEASANPAWIYLDILTGSANSRAVDYDRVDLDAIKEWAQFCDEIVDDNPRFEFNGIFDTSTTVFEALKAVALAGRASFAMKDGKYSVVVDMEKDDVVQQFTPRNSWNFSSVKTFPEETDAIRARFINPDNYWQQDEEIVYDDGKDASNSELFTEVEYFGVTSKTQAYRLGRYDLAVRKLRPETYTLDADVENIVCTRGDRVKVSHDVTGWGISSGRIKSVNLSADELSVVSVVTDGKIVFELGKTYGLTVRKITGIVSFTVSGTGTTNLVYLATAVPIDDAPAAGELYSFGEADSETADCIVQSITYKNDLAATIDLVDYSPAIFNADTEEIPDFDAQISTTPQLPIYAPPVPSIVYSIGDDSVMLVDQNGYCSPRLLVVVNSGTDGAYTARQTIQLRYRKEGDQYWDYDSNTSGIETEFYLDNVEVDDEKAYEFSARSVSRTGVHSDWCESESEYVTGQTVQPTDVYNFASEVGVDYVELTWEHDGGNLGTKVWFEFRVGDSWDDGVFVADPDDVYSYLLAVEDAETFTIWIRARNQAGLYSPNASSLLIEAVRPDDVFGFTAVERGKYIDFSWDIVDGTGVTYEIREGTSWKQASVITTSSTNSVTVSYPVAAEETHTFYIKAKASNGLYSESASAVSITLHPDTESTLILASDRQALYWDGQLLNFDITGSNNLRSNDTYSEYIYSIDLGSSQRTENFYSLEVTPIDRDDIIWDDAEFTWESERAQYPWDNESSEIDYTYDMQIAIYSSSLPSYVYESFEFDDSLVGTVLSTSPSVSANISYLANRFHNGVYIQENTELGYNLSIPEQFSMSITWQGKDQTLLESGINHLLRFEDGSGNRMLILQDETSFYLLDENNDQLAIDMVIEADQYYNIVVGQYATTRVFGVYDVANDNYVKVEGDFAPLTTFTKVNFRFRD